MRSFTGSILCHLFLATLMAVPVPACASASVGCPFAQVFPGISADNAAPGRGCCRQRAAAAASAGRPYPSDQGRDAPAHGPTDSPCGLTCQFCGSPRPPLTTVIDARPAFAAVPYASPLPDGNALPAGPASEAIFHPPRA